MENKIEYKILDDKIIVYFYGELSSSNVSKYRNLINNILDKSSGVVYFDFLHTSFIDSSGIGLVLGRYNQLKNENRKLVLANLSKTAYKVFELSGMFALMEYVEGQLCFTTHNVGSMDILKQRKKSIDFLSENHKIYSWKTNGNYSPSRLYRNGMIEGSPFNVDSIDFISVFGAGGEVE